jgi:LPXTG-motif cell wall-anchored protein
LTVRFTASGFDPNGPIKEYEFDFGDASDGQPQIWKQEESEASHRYQYEGEYVATVKVKDQGGQWRGGNDECRVEIEVNGKPKVLAASTSEELPKTGASALLGAGLLALGVAGKFLRRRFKIV